MRSAQDYVSRLLVHAMSIYLYFTLNRENEFSKAKHYFAHNCSKHTRLLIHVNTGSIELCVAYFDLNHAILLAILKMKRAYYCNAISACELAHSDLICQCLEIYFQT